MPGPPPRPVIKRDPNPDEWTAGCGVGEPGYARAAVGLVYRWVNSRDDIPGNVALALGWLISKIPFDSKGDV